MLLAVGLPHEVERVEGGAALVVPGWAVQRAQAELARWQAENVPQLPEPPPARRSSGRDGALAFALALVSVHLARVRSASGPAWFEAGVLDAARVAGGELQRTLTALLLHLDPPHLMANVGFGALFVGTLCWRLGTGAGLLATLLAGGCGNLGAALLRPDGRAAGASTAVFAALGLLAVLGLRPRGTLPSGRLRRWAPVIAALALFGYLGAEGERVDVLGHAAGFMAG
ncbi:MAG: rhomboid family intramembrane serine protease, partial [Planctomycetes bacterium]|nr:rhomboid family intramembrane serine protease [Planctomycetota bacterium]